MYNNKSFVFLDIQYYLLYYYVCTGLKIFVLRKNMKRGKIVFCSNCGQKIQEDAVFCFNCGANVTGVPFNSNPAVTNIPIENQAQRIPKVNIADTFNKVKDNEFVKSVKNDVGNSQSLNIIKNKVDSTVQKAKNSKVKSKINKKIVIAVVAVIAVLVVVLNLHKCEECEEIYFGEKNVVSFWGERAEVCKDCYEDFYSW